MSMARRLAPLAKTWRMALKVALVMSLALFVGSSGFAANRRIRTRVELLDLESAVAQAELILAVRLAEVTESKVVHGGRSEQVTEQYHLEPVRILKGVFTRDVLLMTGADLGVYRFAGKSDRLERGQMLLVLLGRQNGQLFNCNINCASLAQSIPRLSGQDDRLLDSVKILIEMSQCRDRAEQVVLLRNSLKEAGGRGAGPLLFALRRRALIAAQTPGAMAAVFPHLEGDPRHHPMEQAARTVQAILEADYLVQAELRQEAAKSLARAFNLVGPDFQLRVALLDAIGAVGPAAAQVQPIVDILMPDQNRTTFAEQAALFRAFGQIGATEPPRDFTAAVQDHAAVSLPGSEFRNELSSRIAKALSDLPLDAPPAVEEAAARSLIKLSKFGSYEEIARTIKERLVRKSETGLGIANDLARLGELPRVILPTNTPEYLATSPLLKAFDQKLDVKEQLAFAMAAKSVADPLLVPSLATLLDPGQPQVRYQAIEALRRIDTEGAARALWPHLDEEADLARKLELVTFLGRHGFKGGYAIAIEHLSQPTLRDLAVEALAALNDPRAVPELRRILATSHDQGWNAAALRGLARLGERDLAPRLLEIAGDPFNPLAESALIALGDLGDERVVPLLQKGLASRSDALVIASAEALTKLLTKEGKEDEKPGKIKADELREGLANMLADPVASPAVRVAALESLAALNDPRLNGALAKAVRVIPLAPGNSGFDFALDGMVSNTPLGPMDLGTRVQAELVKRKVNLQIK